MDDRRCNCRHTHVEGVTEHEPGCPMLLPVPGVPRDPYRLSTAQLLREVTGGNEEKPVTPWPLFGIPAAVGVDEPLTHRVGDYMGQPRETAPQWTGQIDGQPLPARAANALGRLFLEPLREVKPMTLAQAGLPPTIVAWHEGQRDTRDDFVLLQPEEQRLIDDIKQGKTAGELRKAIDRFMAGVYDSQIDALAAKRREHTRRLIK